MASGGGVDRGEAAVKPTGTYQIVLRQAPPDPEKPKMMCDGHNTADTRDKTQAKPKPSLSSAWDTIARVGDLDR